MSKGTIFQLRLRVRFKGNCELCVLFNEECIYF